MLKLRAFSGRRRALRPPGHAIRIESFGKCENRIDAQVPCWDEDQQRVVLLPASVAERLKSIRGPLLSSSTGIRSSTSRIIFPLCPDHMMTLFQYNVLRGNVVNRQLVEPLESELARLDSPVGLHVLSFPSNPKLIPPAFLPTVLQQTIPHKRWIDIIPHPVWRDNVILATGTFDEHELWTEVMGGLFEGFPDSEVPSNGVIAWSPPWHISGWEFSEAFLRKWGWSLIGCEEVLEYTNTWRGRRGEEPLVIEL